MPARAATAIVILTGIAAAGCGSGSGGGSKAMSAQSGGASSSTTAPSSTGAPVESATVDIKSFEYKPVTVVVKKGSRVRWTNSDAAAHTSTADDRSFDTQTIEKGKTRMVTMTSAGTFPYHCDFHPFMKATVVVE